MWWWSLQNYNYIRLRQNFSQFVGNKYVTQKLAVVCVWFFFLARAENLVYQNEFCKIYECAWSDKIIL